MPVLSQIYHVCDELTYTFHLFDCLSVIDNVSIKSSSGNVTHSYCMHCQLRQAAL